MRARLLMCAALSIGCHRAPVDVPVPTWSYDIAPLLARRCGPCHGDGRTRAVAPPALDGYREARQAAETSLRAIRRRMMPPFGADDTGLCGTWSDAAWLTDEEIAAFSAWVEHGMPHGFGPPARPEPEPALAAATPQPLELGAPFTPGLGERATRCFLVTPPPALAADWLTGVDVASEPRAAVRQADLYALADAAQVERARALDAGDRQPGWACAGPPALANGGPPLLASWSRNTPGQRSRDGTGVPLRAPAYLALVHYDLIASAPETPVSARFLLTTAASAVEGAARLVPVTAAAFTLPPNHQQARVTATWIVDRDTTLRGVAPRMNTLGRTLDLKVAHGGERRCLAHFGHWDPYDRQLFRAAAPVPLSRGDTVTLDCVFATTSRGADTKMGEAPDDEQCLAHLYLVD